MLNYPSPITEENAARVYRTGTRMLTWLGAAVSITMLGAMLGTTDAVVPASSAAQARTSASS